MTIPSRTLQAHTKHQNDAFLEDWVCFWCLLVLMNAWVNWNRHRTNKTKHNFTSRALLILWLTPFDSYLSLDLLHIVKTPRNIFFTLFSLVVLLVSPCCSASSRRPDGHFALRNMAIGTPDSLVWPIFAHSNFAVTTTWLQRCRICWQDDPFGDVKQPPLIKRRQQRKKLRLRWHIFLGMMLLVICLIWSFFFMEN